MHFFFAISKILRTFAPNFINNQKQKIMAKSFGGALSKFSGRLGGNVLSVSGGMQIIREYQPNVANPRTTLQRAQRARVVLAGKLSQITPDAVIIGLAQSKRDRRSEYTRTIIKRCRVQEENGEFSAVLLPGELTFSKGLTAGNVAFANVAVGSSSVSAAVGFSSDVDAVMVVAVVYNATAERYLYMNYGIATQNEETIEIAIANMQAGASVNLYAIPLQRKTNAGGVTSGGVNNDSGSYVGTLDYANPDIYNHMASQFVGTYAYTPVP